MGRRYLLRRCLCLCWPCGKQVEEGGEIKKEGKTERQTEKRTREVNKYEERNMSAAGRARVAGNDK